VASGALAILFAVLAAALEGLLFATMRFRAAALSSVAALIVCYAPLFAWNWWRPDTTLQLYVTAAAAFHAGRSLLMVALLWRGGSGVPRELSAASRNVAGSGAWRPTQALLQEDGTMATPATQWRAAQVKQEHPSPLSTEPIPCCSPCMRRAGVRATSTAATASSSPAATCRAWPVQTRGAARRGSAPPRPPRYTHKDLCCAFSEEISAVDPTSASSPAKESDFGGRSGSLNR